MEYEVQNEKVKTADVKIKTNQVSNLLGRFKKIVELFFKIQSEHRENCKNKIKRQLEISKIKKLFYQCIILKLKQKNKNIFF